MEDAVFSTSAREVLDQARLLATAMRSDRVEATHLLLALLRSGVPSLIVGQGGEDRSRLEEDLLRTARRDKLSRTLPALPVAAEAKQIIARAVASVQRASQPEVEPEDLFTALCEEPVRSPGVLRLRRPSVTFLLQRAGYSLPRT